MELDDLKNIWHLEAQKVSGNQALNREEIAGLLHHKSKDSISLLIRSLRFEYYLTLVGMFACGVGIPLVGSIEKQWLLGGTLLFCVPFVVYYVKQLKVMRSIVPQGLNIRTELELVVQKLNTYLRWCLVASRIMVPVGMLGGGILGMRMSAGDAWIDIATKPLVAIILLAVTVITGFLVDRLFKWYLTYLYGRHLQNIENLLEAIDE